MSLLLKHLLADKKSPYNRYRKLLVLNHFFYSVLRTQHSKLFHASLALSLCALSSWTQVAQAEGSRTLYPSGVTGHRANLEWRTNTYGGIMLRRTLLKVYANQGEYILLGSSAVRISNGDILVYNPSRVTGSIGTETIPNTPDFKCTSQPGRGFIATRTQELNGPLAVSSSVTANRTNSNYVPCYYKAPSTGIYDIVFFGPAGGNSASDISPTGEINLTSSNNFNANQGSTVAAWDVTVRSSDTSTSDLNGRLFSYYLALFTGNNGRYLNFPVYPVTTDGFQYKVQLTGLDPNGFVLYGNQMGFFDSDGKTPLYHDILGSDSQLTTLEGGVSLSRPQYATFFHPIDPTALPFINRYKPDGTLDGIGIPSTPIIPIVKNLYFKGSFLGNNSYLGTGGTFTFDSNITGNYQLVISRDGTNFDASNSQNRVLRGLMTATGTQSVTWDGKDNSGNNFPVGNNYKVIVTTHGGEYHFPLLDVENNFTGGPTITMLNASNPLGNTTGFYDDRGYKTMSGASVGTPGTVLCGINPPSPAFSDPIKGFDTASNNRKFGQSGNVGNAGTKCTGSFGDTKGLDLWTYYPGQSQPSSLNIINSVNAKLLLVKRITRINNQDITTIVDGQSNVATTATNYVPSPYDNDDNDPNWPANYLQGLINAGTVKPGDELEYTIYFLSKGPSSATNVKFCDLVPANTTFIPTAFNGMSPNDGGLPGADQGIALAVGSTTPIVYLSNVADSDRGRFYPANDPQTPSYCGTNTNGAVAVDITRSPDLPKLPAATGSATPTQSYGFIRFRAKVK